MDRDMTMRYRGGGIGHHSTRSCDALLSRDGPASRVGMTDVEQSPEEEAEAVTGEDSGEDSSVVLEEDSGDDGEADGEAGSQNGAGAGEPEEGEGEDDDYGGDEDAPLERVYEENVYDAPGSDEEEEGSGDEDEDVWDKAGFAAP